MRAIFVNPITADNLDGCPSMAFYTEAHLAARNIQRLPGWQVDFVDFVDTTPDQLIETVRHGAYDLVGLMASAPNRLSVMQLAKGLKTVAPRIRILAFGNFFGQFPEETLSRLPEIDFVASGDSTPVALDLAAALARDDTVAGIKGLSYRSGAGIVVGGKREPADLDQIIYTDHTCFKPTYAVLRPMPLWEEDETKRCYPILTSIGCSNNCPYCHLQSVPYRATSVEKTIDMFDTVIADHGVRNFIIVDPSLACDENRLQAICRGIIDKKMDIRWACEITPTVSVETLELMAAAGCISIHFALETGSARIQAIMRPRSSLTDVKAVCRECVRLGIRFAYFSLLSFPMETLSDVWDTIEALRDLAKLGGFSGIAPVVIMPRTRLEKIAVRRGLIARDFDWFDLRYRSNLSDGDEQSMPHSIEYLTQRQIRYLLGFVLAVQDFAAANPRVANLRYGFLLRMSYLYGCFIWEFLKKKQICKVLIVAARHVTMFVQFWLWKLNPYAPARNNTGGASKEA